MDGSLCRMSLFTQLYSVGFIRSMLWRLWYPFVTRKLQDEGVTFLNYGFETQPPMGVPLSSQEEPNRACIQLYHRVAMQTPLAGKDVLEVSCGHGGGAAYLVRTFRPASYTALDLNPAGIRLCRQRQKEDGLVFQQGDAEKLPWADGTIDVVINIEASHCYADFARFLAEVARVLRPGGHFVYADFRFRDEVPAWERTIAAAPLQSIQCEEITADVVRGLDRNSQRSQELVARRLPKWLHGVGRDFAGVRDSRVYAGFQSGQIEYRSYCFVKPGA